MSTSLELASLRIPTDIASELGIVGFIVDYFKLLQLSTNKRCKLLIQP